MQEAKLIQKLVNKARTKDGKGVPEGFTIKDISASSIYYMWDKDAYQFKFWIYPTNTSKTYNCMIRKEDIMKIIEATRCVNDFNFEVDEDEVENKKEEDKWDGLVW